MAAFGSGMPTIMKEPSTTWKKKGMPSKGEHSWNPHCLQPHECGDAPALSPAISVGSNTCFRLSGTHLIALYSSQAFVRSPIVPICLLSSETKWRLNFAVLRCTLSPNAKVRNDGGSPLSNSTASHTGNSSHSASKTLVPNGSIDAPASMNASRSFA